jgi:ferredoxin-NADP reductase
VKDDAFRDVALAFRVDLISRNCKPRNMSWEVRFLNGFLGGGERGRIDKEMLTKHLRSDEVNHAIFYVCGPPAMLNAMKSILKDKLKITNGRIKVEEFTDY